MEKDLTEHIKKVDPDSSGARLDISYRASSGRHVVVELKRPRLHSLNFNELAAQARKYRKSVTEYYKSSLTNTDVPPLDIYILISKKPIGVDEIDERSLAQQNAKIITYTELITNALHSYQEYLNVNKKISGLDLILSRL